jgi:hypothetical protein
MSTHQAVANGLKSFLTSFTSRYSDPNCYFFFGGLLQELSRIQIDLFSAVPDASQAPLDIAARIAVGKFESQMRLVGFERSRFKAATMTMERLPEEVQGAVNGYPCVGANSRLLVEVVLGNDRRCAREKIVFFAPYDPAMEATSESTSEGEPPVDDQDVE